MSHKKSMLRIGRRSLIFGLTLAVWLGQASLSKAQIIYNDPARINQSFIFLHWVLQGDTTDVSITQWVIPVAGMIPLADNTELRYYTAISGANASSDLFDRDISGLTDTRLHIARTLVEDRMLVAGGINIPTGQTGLDENQFELLHVLSAEKYNFPIKTYGEALGLYGEVLGASEAGRWIVGGGAGAYYSDSYTPVNNDISYQHGLRLYLTGSAETAAGESSIDRVKFDGVLILALADEADDQKVFKDGLQLDVSATGRRRLGQWVGSAQARLILRGKDQRLSQGGDLAAESYVSTGSEFRLSAQASYGLSDRWDGTLDVSGKFLAGNGYPEDDLLYDGGATLFGIGGWVHARLTPRTLAAFGLRKWFGNAAEGGLTEALDLNGWEITQGLTVIF